jgi:hypothetical protein
MLEQICDMLLAPNQTTFVRGTYILESVVSAHEIVHDSIKSKEKGLILKLDYERAYDKVNWQCLEEMLRSRGFGTKCVNLVMRVVKGGSICINLNNENSPFFCPGKGLRQGGPSVPTAV